jgi:hypothetical protein
LLAEIVSWHFSPVVAAELVEAIITGTNISRHLKMSRQLIRSSEIAPETKRRFVEAIALAARLRARVLANLAAEHEFRSLERAVEAIPIAADEYAWLQTRVRNAEDYNRQRELHAAAYELALVTNRLLTRNGLQAV